MKLSLLTAIAMTLLTTQVMAASEIYVGFTTYEGKKEDCNVEYVKDENGFDLKVIISTPQTGENGEKVNEQYTVDFTRGGNARYLAFTEGMSYKQVETFGAGKAITTLVTKSKYEVPVKLEYKFRQKALGVVPMFVGSLDAECGQLVLKK